jgi:hypothetical protein
MKTFTHGTVAESIGRTLGHAWMAYKRREGRVLRWMVGNGLSAGSANVALWTVKLLVLGVLLYVAFWAVLLLMLAVVAVWSVRFFNWNEEEQPPEWRDGLLGFGLYDKDGFRIDPHDPDEQP